MRFRLYRADVSVCLVRFKTAQRMSKKTAVVRRILLALLLPPSQISCAVYWNSFVTRSSSSRCDFMGNKCCCCWGLLRRGGETMSTTDQKKKDIERLQSYFQESVRHLDIDPQRERALCSGNDAKRASSMSEISSSADAITAIKDQSIPLLYDCMMAPGRVYHSVPHLFDVMEPFSCQQNPIAILAVLFHDIVYLSIDQELSPAIQALVPEVMVTNTNGRPSVTLSSWNGNWMLRMVDTVFGGIRPQNTNEYVSALVAVRVLAPILSPPQLLQVSTCIEATVPFRPNDPETGATPMEGLFERVKRANQELPSPQQGTTKSTTTAATIDSDEFVLREFTEQQLVQTVQEAALTANCDLGSFSTPNFDKFLDNSWSLLPEWHTPLLDEEPAVEELHRSILLLMTRYESINIERIFPYFRNAPTDKTIAESRRQTRNNMDVTHEYSWVRLCSTGSALGCLQQQQLQSSSLNGNQFWKTFRKVCKRRLPRPETRPEGMTYQVLSEGRNKTFEWDILDDPWGAYLYRTLGPERIVSCAERALAAAGDEDFRWWWSDILSEESRALLEQIVTEVVSKCER